MLMINIINKVEIILQNHEFLKCWSYLWWIVVDSEVFTPCSLCTVLFSLVMLVNKTEQCSFISYSHYRTPIHLPILLHHLGIFELVLWISTYVCSVEFKGVCWNFLLFCCFQIQGWSYLQCRLLALMRSLSPIHLFTVLWYLTNASKF